MAGMLPGVECARRRRFHQRGDSPGAAAQGGTRRSSFCLYASNNYGYHSSVSSLKQRSIFNNRHENEKLGGVARKAKERLHERLRAKISETRRHSGTGRERVADGRSVATGELQTEVSGAKKSEAKKFNWAKLSWEEAGQDECTICLDCFKSGETLVHLPCAHRFHPRCLVPWLQNSAHCPCCRVEIRVQFS